MNNRSRNWILWVLVFFLVWMVSAASLHAQTFTTLLQFNDTDGAYPSSALVQGVNGSSTAPLANEFRCSFRDVCFSL